MNTRIEEKLTAIPKCPKEFGEDGGHFYRYYDALADEIDEDMVKSLKAQLDGILIYVRTTHPIRSQRSVDDSFTMTRLVSLLASTLHFWRSLFPK